MLLKFLSVFPSVDWLSARGDGASGPGTSLASSILGYDGPYSSLHSSADQGEASAWPRQDIIEGAASFQPTSTEIAVDYFLKKLANKEISLR